MLIDYLPVSWEEYHTLAQKLATKLLSHGIRVDEIIAISRGGLTLGHLLTDFLRVPISTFTIQSYSNLSTQGQVKITKPLTTPIHDKHILLVDDVSDTGKTLVRALEYLKAQQPKMVTTVTLFYRPRSVYKPDYVAKTLTTSDWIIFPYEVTETLITIFNTMRKEKRSDAQIKQLLKTLHFTKEQIAFAEKFYCT
jgi:uncharacterized protein